MPLALPTCWSTLICWEALQDEQLAALACHVGVFCKTAETLPALGYPPLTYRLSLPADPQ